MIQQNSVDSLELEINANGIQTGKSICIIKPGRLKLSMAVITVNIIGKHECTVQSRVTQKFLFGRVGGGRPRGCI